MFNNAIVRRPSKSMVKGITSNPQLGMPVFENAASQHDEYIATLEKCGVHVHVLEADENYPDACFVEDVAVCTREFSMVANPGTQTRKGEEKEIVQTLKKFYGQIECIKEPGTLEGGDVMMVGDHFYIGLSGRTNAEGARQLIAALEKYGMTGSVVAMQEMLHLKTGLAYLEDNILLVAGEFQSNKQFQEFKKIHIEPDEAYAANCIRVNNAVLVPAGFEKAREKIEVAGLLTATVDTSEFRKLDGGLSCLSLRF